MYMFYFQKEGTNVVAYRMIKNKKMSRSFKTEAEADAYLKSVHEQAHNVSPSLNGGK